MSDVGVEGRVEITIKNTFIQVNNGRECSPDACRRLVRASSDSCIFQKPSLLELEQEQLRGGDAQQEFNVLLTGLSDAETDSLKLLSGSSSPRSPCDAWSTHDSEGSVDLSAQSSEKEVATTQLEETAKRLASDNAKLAEQNRMLLEKIAAMPHNGSLQNTSANVPSNDSAGLGPQTIMMWFPGLFCQANSNMGIGVGEQLQQQNCPKRKKPKKSHDRTSQLVSGATPTRKCKGHRQHLERHATCEEKQIHTDLSAREKVDACEPVVDAAATRESPTSEDRTTVMWKNLPNNYTRSMLLRLIDQEGFGGQYDFFYLPMDFITGASLGYAFVNLTSTEHAQRFQKTFNGFSRWEIPTRKSCGVSWSDPHQGLQANIERYRSSPIMHERVPDECKPMLFVDGIRAPFPEGTKNIRAPRVRNCAEVAGGSYRKVAYYGFDQVRKMSMDAQKCEACNWKKNKLPEGARSRPV